MTYVASYEKRQSGHKHILYESLEGLKLSQRMYANGMGDLEVYNTILSIPDLADYIIFNIKPKDILDVVIQI